MSISDNKYTGKKTKTKLKRLISSSKLLKDVKHRKTFTSKITYSIFKDGELIYSDNYMSAINCSDLNNYSKIVINTIRLNGATEINSDSKTINITSKSCDNLMLKSSIELIGIK